MNKYNVIIREKKKREVNKLMSFIKNQSLILI